MTSHLELLQRKIFPGAIYNMHISLSWLLHCYLPPHQTYNYTCKEIFCIDLFGSFWYVNRTWNCPMEDRQPKVEWLQQYCGYLLKEKKRRKRAIAIWTTTSDNSTKSYIDIPQLKNMLRVHPGTFVEGRCFRK